MGEHIMEDFQKYFGERIRAQVSRAIGAAPSQSASDLAKKILRDTYQYDVGEDNVVSHRGKVVGEFVEGYYNQGKLFIKLKMHALLMVNTYPEDSNEH
jgi:hypothetical protein